MKLRNPAYMARKREYWRARRKVTRERINEIRRRRWIEEPQFRLSEILRARLRGALGRRQKSGSSVELLGCTIEEAVAHIEAQFQPGMTWDDRGAWHIDHKRPLASFNLEEPADLAAACHFTNLQPLWKLDNLRKGARYVAPQPTGQGAENTAFYKSDYCGAAGAAR